jgi:uncharacterized membrane protein
MTTSLTVIETQNSNTDRHPDLTDVSQWIELVGYVIHEPEQDTMRLALEPDQAGIERYNELVGQRRVASVWAKGKLLRFVTKLESEGFEIPYTLTSDLPAAEAA